MNTANGIPCMIHCILVKWKKEQSPEISKLEALFADCASIPGVYGVQFVPCCVDRENRYHLCIAISMQPDALENWDASAIHRAWKQTYSCLIEQKAIFDFMENSLSSSHYFS